MFRLVLKPLFNFFLNSFYCYPFQNLIPKITYDQINFFWKYKVWNATMCHEIFQRVHEFKVNRNSKKFFNKDLQYYLQCIRANKWIPRALKTCLRNLFFFNFFRLRGTFRNFLSENFAWQHCMWCCVYSSRVDNFSAAHNA